MLSLPNVTMICVDCVSQGEAVAAIQKSLKQIKPARTLFLTDIDYITDEFEVIKINKIKSKNEYSSFLLKEAYRYIHTPFVLVVQHDSWVLNADSFNEALYDCDYAGALWLETDGLANGNGGFSWRSKKLMETVAKDDFINSLLPEDVALCRVYRSYLEKNYGLKWASDELCEQFSFELKEPTQKTFGFHSYFYPSFKDHIVIKRSGASGDIIMMEPLIDYYSKLGYQVVLDIPESEVKLFAQYPHPLKHISQLNPKIQPVKEINLDMAYEIKPKQAVLKSYYEMAGIENGEMRNSKLYIHQEPHQKLFQKYILIHNDETSMPHRNSYGVNWSLVVAYYQKLGSTVLQVGNNPREQVATHFTCPTKDMLMYMVKGADLLIGLDSGVCQLSVALGTPCVILSGSVDLKLRYVDFEKIGVVQGECPKAEDKNCYHSQTGSTTGVKCKYNEQLPACAQHSEYAIIKEANKLLKLN